MIIYFAYKNNVISRPRQVTVFPITAGIFLPFIKNWTTREKDIHLKVYPSEIENEMVKIVEQGHNYPNLSKENPGILRKLSKLPIIKIIKRKVNER